MNNNIPPQNIEAEQALLGAIMIDHEILDVAADLLLPSDFYAAAHETIFAILMHLANQGERIDRIAVAEALRQRDTLEKVGGSAYLGVLSNSVQTTASATYYAKIIREKAILRSLISAGGTIAKLGFESEADVDTAIDTAEQLVLAINDRSTGSTGTAMVDVMKRTYDSLHRRTQGLTTGFIGFDNMTTGLHPGNLFVIAGRPGMGKTAFALSMARAAAEDARARDMGQILFVSLEMSEEELGKRLIAMDAGIDLNTLRRGEVTERQMVSVGSSLALLSSLPMTVDDAGTLAVNQLRSRARRLKMRTGLAAIVVDYLQLLHPSPATGRKRDAQNRNEEISEICRTLKATAKDLNVPIVALAQLNRGVEGRADKRPMLADLRDSGSIEQEADMVAFLYRDSYYEREQTRDDGNAELIIAKQRNGPTGTIPVRFLAPYARYESVLN